MDADVEYMIARTSMEGAIADFLKKAKVAGISDEYIVEDITEAVSNASDEDIALVTEDEYVEIKEALERVEKLLLLYLKDTDDEDDEDEPLGNKKPWINPKTGKPRNRSKQ